MKLLLRTIIILILVVRFASSSVAALEPVIASDEFVQQNLNSNIEILEDPQGDFTIEHVSSPDFDLRFQKSPGRSINFGYTNSVYWVRVKLRNQSLLNENWLLETKPANINSIELYKPTGDSSGFNRIKTGVSMPASSRDFFHHRFVFNLNLPFQQDKTFYLRFQNQSTLVIDINLWHQLEFLNKNKAEYFLLGIFYGTLLIMLVYNLFLFLSLREASYFYYIAFFIFFLVWNVLYEGIAQLYLLPDGFRINQKFELLTLSISGILLLSFAKAYLNLRAFNPQLSGIITSLQATSGLVLVFLPFVGYATTARLLAFLALISLIIIVISFVILRKKENKPGRFHFAAWGAFIFGFFLFLLVRIGFLPANQFNEFSYRFGFVWMITMLSLALADSINALKDKTETANRELQKSEQLFKAIFNQTYQLIGVLTPEGLVLKINKTALSFSDIEISKIEGKPFWEGPWWGTLEHRELVRKGVQKAAQGEFVRFETFHLDFKGKKHTIDFSLKPIFDEWGKISMLIPEGRDITERKEMENVIRESEEKHRKFVELAQDGILVFQDGIIKYANPYMEEMTGYTVSELQNIELKKFVSNSSFEQITYFFFIEKKAKSYPAIHETTFIHKDGTERYIEYISNSIQYQSGEAWLVFIRNVHSRKLAELELAKSKADLESTERRYQLLYDRSVVGMYTSRASDGHIININKEAGRIFGIKSELNEQHPFYTRDFYVNKRDRLDMLKTLFKRGIIYNYQAKFRKVTGKEFWAEFSIKYYPDQNLIEGTIKDITTNKEAEEVLQRSQEELNQLVKERTKQLEKSQNELLEKTQQLEQSNQKLQEAEYQTRSILENSPDFIFNVDASGGILYSNRKIDSYGQKQVIGHSILNFTAREHRELLESSIHRAFESGSADNIEINMQLAADSNHWFEIRFAGLQQADKLSQVMIIATDITKRMLAESNLATAQNLAVEKAHKAGMADIAAGILHNVGNLLNSVNTSVHVIGKVLKESAYESLNQANTLLKNNLDSLEEFIANDPKGKMLLQYYLKLGETLSEEHLQVLQNTNRVKEKLNLISGVLAAQQSFTEADSLTEKHSLTAIVEDVLTIHAGSMERFGIEIIKDFCELPKIPVQKAKLVHVLISLLDNATESMAEMSSSKKSITISITHTPNDAYLRVTDSGLGIRKENLKKIFMHGYKNSQNRQCFNLHCSAIYMSEMNGTIWADSEGVNQGATFVLKLPKHQS